MRQCPVEFLGLGLDEGRRGTQRTCCRTSLLRKLHLGHGPGALPSQIEAVIDSVVAMYKALDRGMKLLGSSVSLGPATQYETIHDLVPPDEEKGKTWRRHCYDYGSIVSVS